MFCGLVAVMFLVSAVTGLGDDGVTCERLGDGIYKLEVCRDDETGEVVDR